MTLIKAMGDLCFDFINALFAIILIVSTLISTIFSSNILQYIKDYQESEDVVEMKYIIIFSVIFIYSTLFVIMCCRYSKHIQLKEKKKQELEKEQKAIEKEEKKLEKELENTKQYLEIVKKSVTIEEYEIQKTYLEIKTRSYITCTKFEVKENNDDYFIVIIVEQNDEEIHTDCFSISKPKPQKSKIIIN